MTESFPRLHARTRRFTLGVPRGFTISPDGRRVVFLRTRSGTDPVTCLWELDVPSDGATGAERLVVDPLALGAADEDLPPEERARRERSRESAGGVVAYATDRETRLAVFALSGELYLAELATGEVRRLPAAGPVIDPRLDPTGTRVAYVTGGALHVLEIATGTDTTLAEPESDTVTYGLAEFIAAEEMDRMRGYWWSPSGDRLLVARVDEAPVALWHIADPANP
ncbi:DPP IV N-terminal domain-containing protein, partial [Microbispora triticiradicis]|uniref:DPP IV N-terminal domain-containing protein n=1 Tax=Microbispora triticiradicis TaxID=2200763 RepID=UPI001AD6C7F6